MGIPVWGAHGKALMLWEGHGGRWGSHGEPMGAHGPHHGLLDVPYLTEYPNLTACFFLGALGWGDGDTQARVVVDVTGKKGEVPEMIINLLTYAQ